MLLPLFPDGKPHPTRPTRLDGEYPRKTDLSFQWQRPRNWVLGDYWEELIAGSFGPVGGCSIKKDPTMFGFSVCFPFKRSQTKPRLIPNSNPLCSLPEP